MFKIRRRVRSTTESGTPNMAKLPNSADQAGVINTGFEPMKLKQPKKPPQARSKPDYAGSQSVLERLIKDGRNPNK
jgi:hypothetical protein